MFMCGIFRQICVVYLLRYHSQKCVVHLVGYVCGVVYAVKTSSDGKNRLSFSTATTRLAPLLRMERVRAPGPAPTSHTQQPLTSPAWRTTLST